ncbi:MAG: hypothetical protein U1F43_34360 [Myxococcota bacterium]
MKVRFAGFLAVALSLSIGCGGEELLTTTTTTGSGTSKSDGNGSDGSDTNALLITGAVVLGLSVAATVIALTADDDSSFSYLERHQQEVRVALARGDGPFVGDVAQRLGLPAPLIPHLGRVLRRARPDLEPELAGGHIDKARARAFARALVAALASDPLLAPYLEDALVVATAR